MLGSLLLAWSTSRHPSESLSKEGWLLAVFTLWGKVSRLRISQGSATFAPAVFVQVSVVFVALCVSPQSHNITELYKNLPGFHPRVNFENPWGRMFSPSQAPSKIKGFGSWLRAGLPRCFCLRVFCPTGYICPGVCNWNGLSETITSTPICAFWSVSFQMVSHRRPCQLSECLKWVLPAVGEAEHVGDQCNFSCHL